MLFEYLIKRGRESVVLYLSGFALYFFFFFFVDLGFRIYNWYKIGNLCSNVCDINKKEGREEKASLKGGKLV